MTELHELWARAEGDSERLATQVRWILDVDVCLERERERYSDFWDGELDALLRTTARVSRVDPPLVTKLNALKRFVRETWYILEFIGNHVAYGSFDELRAKELGHG
jgi:hypothetical protein